jgi:hypothetical protein
VALNGILFGAVVIMWAVFLVPWALRRYDEATSVRPIETFSDALRVLGRRPEQQQPVAARASLKTQPRTCAGASVRTPSRSAARAAAARRRRVLITLLVATLVVGVLAVFGVVPGWAVAVGAGLVVGWLVLCRVQVRHEDEAAWVRRRQTGGDAPNDEKTVRIATRPATEAVIAQSAPPYAREENAAPVRDEDLMEATSVAVPVTAEDGSSLWDPLPVTLPTYVSKPRAARSIRTIDLGAPGAWTSGHVEGEQTEMPAAKDETEHRRAVGD